jgi:hypothetical protein
VNFFYWTEPPANSCRGPTLNSRTVYRMNSRTCMTEVVQKLHAVWITESIPGWWICFY